MNEDGSVDSDDTVNYYDSLPGMSSGARNFRGADEDYRNLERWLDLGLDCQISWELFDSLNPGQRTGHTETILSADASSENL